MSLKSDTRPEINGLPPDGGIVMVDPWRRVFRWALAVVLIVTGLSVAYEGFRMGDPLAIFWAVWGLVVACFAVRLALGGMVIEREGIKERNILWTHRWKWSEIDHFELKPLGYSPRLRLHLQDGRVRKMRGVCGRFSYQEARTQALYRALERRLAEEQASDAGGLSPAGAIGSQEAR